MRILWVRVLAKPGRLIAGDEFARSSPGFGEPFCPAGNAEYRQGAPEQRAEQPGPSSPAGYLRLVRALAFAPHAGEHRPGA